MTLQLEPELGVPYSEESPFTDLTVRTEAMCNTIATLYVHDGFELSEPTPEDVALAAEIAAEYADNPEKASKKHTEKDMGRMTPASLLLTGRILHEFGQAVVKDSKEIRYLVTNKLLIETENPDAKVRLKALELLGKHSDVGLFTEKSEMTITHQTTSDLRTRLREKLERLVEGETEEPHLVLPESVDGEFTEIIDVDKELGLTETKK